MALFLLVIVLIFKLERLPFYFTKKLKGMIDMYFTDTPELRKLEREMKRILTGTMMIFLKTEKVSTLIRKFIIRIAKIQMEVNNMKTKIRSPTDTYYFKNNKLLEM